MRAWILILLALAACGDRSALRGQPQADTESVRDALAHLNALEDRVFVLLDVEPETGRLVLLGSAQDLQDVKREARTTAVESCTANARDELVHAVDHILRAQTDSAAVGESWARLYAYRRSAESCEGWLLAQAPH